MPRIKAYRRYIVLCEYDDDRPAASVEVYAKSENEALNKARELVNRWRYTVVEVYELRD